MTLSALLNAVSPSLLRAMRSARYRQLKTGRLEAFWENTPGLTDADRRWIKEIKSALLVACHELHHFHPGINHTQIPVEYYADWAKENCQLSSVQVIARMRLLDLALMLALRDGVINKNPFDDHCPDRCRGQAGRYFMEWFVDYLEHKGDSANTIRWYRNRLEVFVGYLETSLPETEVLASATIEGFYKWLHQTGRSAHTIKGFDTALRHFFSVALKEGVFPQNLMDGVPRQKAPNKVHDTFSKAEIRQLLMGIQHHETSPLRERDVVVLRLLYDTGMRTGALCSIRYPQDIDNNLRKVRVHTKFDKEILLGYGRRTQEAITVYLNTPERWPSDYLLANYRGDPLTVGGINKAHHRWCKQAGVRYRKPHYIRSTAASEWYRAGFAPQQVQSGMGHEDFETTKIYITTAEHDMAVEMMQNFAPGDRLDD